MSVLGEMKTVELTPLTIGNSSRQRKEVTMSTQR